VTVAFPTIFAIFSPLEYQRQTVNPLSQRQFFSTFYSLPLHSIIFYIIIHSFNIFTSSPVTAQNVVLFESAFVKSLVGWRKMRQPIDVDRTSLVTVWFVIAHRENLKYVAYSYCFFEYKEKLKYG